MKICTRKKVSPMSKTPSCCGTDKNHDKHGGFSFDPILHGSLLIILAALLLHFGGSFTGMEIPFATPFAHGVLDLLSKMWWGVVLGLIFVGLMTKVPREYFRALLGRGDTVGGVFRAALAGLLLDLCSHGILMIGAKLYERGASLAQVMTFLIASPWNSFSMTLILFALVGIKWTLIFIGFSAVIAISTGFIYLVLTKRGVFPENPNKVENTKGFSLKSDAKKRLKNFKADKQFFHDVFIGGWHEAKMLIRWLLLGVVIAACIRTFVSPEMFSTWFGPTVIGLLLTLAATTIIEVCSEGSSPIAAELLNRAGAPGNAFTFLMAGVSTDYTEMLIIKEFTRKWSIALSLPLITVPQVLLLGYIMNVMGG